MLDIGLFEFLFIAVLGLLVAGPEKLPKYIAQAGKALKGFKEMANKAKSEIVESAGLKDVDIPNFKNISPTNLASKIFDEPKDQSNSKKNYDNDAT
jgi:sec-independent protein translocase protein TatB